jgi:hypothetical protein
LVTGESAGNFEVYPLLALGTVDIEVHLVLDSFAIWLKNFDGVQVLVTGMKNFPIDQGFDDLRKVLGKLPTLEIERARIAFNRIDVEERRIVTRF